MQFSNRTLTIGTAALLTTGTVAGCTSETKLTQADQSTIPTEELIGDTMTLTTEIQQATAHGIITIGKEDTVIIADQIPEDLSPGEDVEVTGTVQERDAFTIDDLETLQQVTDQETAQYFVNRDEELVLTDATVTRTD